MDEWSGLRTAVVVVTWLTVLGGLTLAAIWIARGGAKAVGPEDEGLDHLARQHARGRSNRAVATSFSLAQVGVHGLLGVLTAALITYAAARGSDRSSGYLAILTAIAATGLPGVLMFRKWISNTRPATAAVTPRSGRVEDEMPKAVVYGHGVGAVAAAAMIVVLLIVD
jgi:hypothetical protein